MGEWKRKTNRELEDMDKGENIVKWIKGQRISWVGHLERMEEDRVPKKIFTQELVGTRRRMERRSRKRSLSAGNQTMERAGDRQGKMEGHCSTGQSPQRAVVPMEGEEEEKEEKEEEEEKRRKRIKKEKKRRKKKKNKKNKKKKTKKKKKKKKEEK